MIKKAILVIFLISIQFSLCQENLDTLIDKGIAFYQKNEKKEALKIWTEIEEQAEKSSSTYGTTLGNILYYYVEEKDEENIQKYYSLIINSKLNDRDKKNKLGEPYKNYRYNATMSLAAYYANNKNFNEALKYIEKADSEIIYENSSLTAYIYKKVDLAFWKRNLLKDLNKKDEALYVLIKRAFEYDYKNMYKNWVTVSPSTDELELSEAIVSDYKDIKDLKTKINLAIESLPFENSKKIVLINFNNSIIEIKLYRELKTKEECIAYLKNSFFYKYIETK